MLHQGNRSFNWESIIIACKLIYQNFNFHQKLLFSPENSTESSTHHLLMTTLYHVGSLKCLNEVTTEISKLGISHLVCGPRTMTLLGRSHFHFCGCRVHILETLKATKFKFENSELQPLKETQIPQLILIQNYVCAILVSGYCTLEIAHSMTKETQFLFCRLKPLSFSWSHLSIQWIHSLLQTLHQPQSHLLLEHPSKKLYFSLLQEK